MKVIFLDVDGVLTSVSYYKQSSDEERRYFDPTCLENLKHIIDMTGAYIVVSSDWKNSEEKMNRLLIKLEEYGLKDKYIGCTPVVEENSGYYVRSNRGFEIDFYLSDHKCDSFVILDDLDHDLNIFLDYVVLTNNEFGLTKKDADKAIELLSNVRKR